MSVISEDQEAETIPFAKGKQCAQGVAVSSGAQRPYYQGPTAPVGARAVGPPSLAGNPPRGPPGGPPSSYPSGASSARPAFAAFPPSFGSAAVPSPGPPSFQGGGAPPGPPAFGVPSNSNAMQGRGLMVSIPQDWLSKHYECFLSWRLPILPHLSRKLGFLL